MSVKIIEVRTQKELDAALLVVGATVRCMGDGHFVLRGSSSAELRESSSAVLWESSRATASRFVAVQIHGSNCRVDGGVQIQIPDITTAKLWCEWHGVPINCGVAILYKGVGDTYLSPRGGDYTPGTIPTAPDWDGGKAECGGGLHFSPRPSATRRYASSATKYVACPVRVKDIVVHFPADYPDKVKAPGCCAPVYEVGIDGKPLPMPTTTEAAS